jgi:hypothetical protein
MEKSLRSTKEHNWGAMKGGMLRSAIALPFSPAFFSGERPARDLSGADLFLGVDARAEARCGFHSAIAGALDLLVATKGVGPLPLPAVIWSIDRLEATDMSSCKILSSSLPERIHPDV